jgi:hypothetical protein
MGESPGAVHSNALANSNDGASASGTVTGFTLGGKLRHQYFNVVGATPLITLVCHRGPRERGPQCYDLGKPLVLEQQPIPGRRESSE